MHPPPREVFLRHKLRCTPQREAVYSALCAAKSHPTAEELYTTVRASDSAISLATIYNALDAFTRAGIARRLATPHAVVGGGAKGGAFRYDADIHNHAHIVTADGSVVDLPDDLSTEVLAHIPPSVVQRIEARTGRKLSRISVEFLEAPANPT
jgi:Fe2+ or Zn2+ uptake regulation protein